MLPDAASGHVAIQLGAGGPNMAVVSACSTGTGAIGEAWETIRRGDAEAIIAGGTDNPLLPVLLAGFHALRALANDAEHPERACKPFDKRARRLRRRAGRGGDGARVAGLREGARRGDLRRGDRLRLDQRRVRHGRVARKRPRVGDGDDARADEGRASSRRRSTTSTRTAPARRSTTAPRRRRSRRRSASTRTSWRSARRRRCTGT